jgi:hypothetical protein
MPEQPTARQRIERAFHVSFKLPGQAAELLDAYRDEVLAEFAQGDAREILARHRDQVLTEAAAIASTVIGPLWHLDTLHEITERLNAARTAPDAP